MCVCPTLGFLHIWLWLSLSDELTQLIHLPKGHSSEMKAKEAESGSESSVLCTIPGFNKNNLFLLAKADHKKKLHNIFS